MLREAPGIPNFSPEQTQSILSDLVDKALDLDQQVIDLYKNSKGNEAFKDRVRELKAQRNNVFYGMLEVRGGTPTPEFRVAVSSSLGEYSHEYAENKVYFYVDSETDTIPMHSSLDLLARPRGVNSRDVLGLIGIPDELKYESPSEYASRMCEELLTVQLAPRTDPHTENRIYKISRKLSERLITLRGNYPNVPLEIGIFRARDLILFFHGDDNRPLIQRDNSLRKLPWITTNDYYESLINESGGFDFWIIGGEQGALSVVENPRQRGAYSSGSDKPLPDEE